MNVPHDLKLYSMQIFFAMASSSISWGGPYNFSMGGAVTMSFASHFPDLVDSIVLLAPGGILRDLPQAYKNPCFYYPHLVPHWYLRRQVCSLLGLKPNISPLVSGTTNERDGERIHPDITEETKETNASLVDVATILQWQFDHHQGFIHSFTNTIQQRIFMHQHHEWEKVCKVINGETPSRSRLFNSKLLAVFGDEDEIVVEKDVIEDLTAMLGGSERLVVKSVAAGHDFPVPCAEEVVDHIAASWGLA